MNLVFGEGASPVKPQTHLPNEVLSKQSEDGEKNKNEMDQLLDTNDKQDEELDDIT